MSEELQELIDSNPEWYKSLQYDDVKSFIKANIESTSRSFIAIGYYLKYARDNELFKEDGYTGILEFAQSEFGISKSWASKWMSINDQFSVSGNSPILLEQYKEFSSSKLSEMLYLSDEQREQVTITTTNVEIRELKNPAKVEVKVSVPKTEIKCFIRKDLEDGLMCAGGISDECNKCDRFDPVETEEKSIDDLELSVRTYNCLKRAGIDTINELCDLTEDKVIAIRNVSRKCLDEINEKVSAIGKSLKSDITEIVSIESEYIETVTNETEENRIPDPDLSCKFDPDAKCLTASKESCKRINDDRCMYSSGWDEEDYITVDPEQSVELDSVETVEADIIQPELEEVKQGTNYSINAVYSILKKAKSDYEEVIEVGGAPEALAEKRLIIRDALLDYYQELRGRDTVWYQKPQPELPILRNNDQRKDFVDAYETWPVWIDQELTGEKYYRYDFDNGDSMVVKVYYCKVFDYKSTNLTYEERFRDDWGKEEYYLLEPDKYFKDCETNKSALVDYLKEIQKKGG